MLSRDSGTLGQKGKSYVMVCIVGAVSSLGVGLWIRSRRKLGASPAGRCSGGVDRSTIAKSRRRLVLCNLRNYPTDGQYVDCFCI